MPFLVNTLQHSSIRILSHPLGQCLGNGPVSIRTAAVSKAPLGRSEIAAAPIRGLLDHFTLSRGLCVPGFERSSPSGTKRNLADALGVLFRPKCQACKILLGIWPMLHPTQTQDAFSGMDDSDQGGRLQDDLLVLDVLQPLSKISAIHLCSACHLDRHQIA
ncbi:hypothetical protein Q31b_51270 [Novipirellula aureliae]|uniref:Uncharacterized protein n=1 Tax=Novipirellula aureliae TaxID=2527966 RepID=A0A5C6DGC1_9BACT|nr:hypothetical protein Q31b_51270 [Novipirellula aureliae]